MTMGNYLTAAAILLSVVVNVSLLAYAWGSLRQIVIDLKDIVSELRRAVDAIFTRINKAENRLERLETTCSLRHPAAITVQGNPYINKSNVFREDEEGVPQ